MKETYCPSPYHKDEGVKEINLTEKGKTVKVTFLNKLNPGKGKVVKTF